MDELWGHVRQVLDDRCFIVDVTATAADDAYAERETVEASADVHVGDFVHVFVARRDGEGKIVGEAAIEAELDPDDVTNDDVGWELVVGREEPVSPVTATDTDDDVWDEDEEEPAEAADASPKPAQVVAEDPAVDKLGKLDTLDDGARGRGRRAALRARRH